jgi:hypothetical protein
MAAPPALAGRETLKYFPSRKILSGRECEPPDRVGGRRIALYTAGTLAINGLMHRAVRGAPLRPDLDARSVPRVLAGAAALVAVVFGVGLATKPSLEAAGVPYPGMIASAIAMAALVAGGQMLMRYRKAVLMRQSGGRG